MLECFILYSMELICKQRLHATVTVSSNTNTKCVVSVSRSDSMADESADFSASQSCCTEPDENEVTIKQDIRIGQTTAAGRSHCLSCSMRCHGKGLYLAGGVQPWHEIKSVVLVT